MSKIRVGVLRGGIDDEYEVSLKTGTSVLEHLPKDKYQPVDVFIDREGGWHVGGISRGPDDIAVMVDVVFNALHGAYGEDGKVQQILEAHKIPYTGSSILSSAVGMKKELAKEMAKRAGIKVPYHQLITREEYTAANPADLFRSIMLPVVVKLPAGGSAIGASFAETPEELWRGIETALRYGDVVMLEQHIRGKEATVGVVDNFRGREFYSLLPIEIARDDYDTVWSYGDRYNGKMHELCPGQFSREEKQELERLAILIHQAIGARHYSRSDFIVSPRGIYFLEINTLPGLTKESLLPRALAACGTSMPQFLDHVISLALSS